nr:hypothetical protein [Tanacetum cinerariifolium]
MNVAGARENVGSLVVQQSGIQCFNCKEFGYFAKECRKPKRVKDLAYHKEKMLMCKQVEKGVPLQAGQYDWLADTDEEIDEQEFEAHYSYMAKIQEVPTADSGTDFEPLEQVQNDTGYNVFSNKLQHFERSESISNTCLVETDDSNVIPDSPDMCDDDIQNDQNDVESDDERVTLADLIANLKLDNKHTEFEKYKAFNDRTIDYDKLEHTLAELQCLYLHKVKECDCLAQKLSKQTKCVSNEVYAELSRRFAKLEKHSISLELALQKCKEHVKNDTVWNEQASNVFRKERKQYIEIQDLKAQLQDKNIAISELKKVIEKSKRKSVETKFDKPSVVRQPNAQRNPKPSVLGKPAPFSDSFERRYFSKTKSVPKTNVSKGLLKPVTAQTLPQTARQVVSNTNVLKPGMYQIDNKTTQTRAPQSPHTVRNTNPRVSTSTGVNYEINVSRPQHRSNQMKDKVMPNNSQVKLKKTQVEDHPRIHSISNKNKSVTTCNDSLNSRTLNANAVCATCGKSPIEGYEDAIVVPPINANNFELKQTLINLVQSNQFTGRQNPHNHLRFFNKVTSTFRHPEVLNTTIKLLLFLFSLEGQARTWLDKEPPHSILTWEDLVSKFINQFFPPSKTTYLRNKITFLQKPNETFNEAWERFKDLLRQCPHRGFSELHQLDTFYNALNPNDQDVLDSAAGGNFLDKIPRECLSIIESKSKVQYSRSRVTNSRANTNAPPSYSSPSNSFDLQQIDASLEDKLDIRMNRFKKSLNDMKAFITPIVPIKAVEEVCITCGANHRYSHCPLARENEFPVFHDNIQQFQTAAVGNFIQGNRHQNVSNQMRPLGFNQPNQQNQNRYQGNNFNSNQNRQNNQGAVYQNRPQQAPTYQALAQQNMCMRTRHYCFPPTVTIPRRSRKHTSNVVEPEIRTIVEMADKRTMAQMLQAPIEGYEDAIVVPPINANNFELKQTHPEVPNTTIKLLLFSFSLEGEVRIWLDKEPSRSILTWEDLVSKFINQFFPPSKTTYLRNEITNFLQKQNEMFNEAWERFKDLLRQCPHHGFSELHQLDTFYNALNPNDQDALESAAGGNFLDKIPRECLSIIESKSKVRYSRCRVTDLRANTNVLPSSSLPSNSFDLQQNCCIFRRQIRHSHESFREIFK